MAKRKPKKKSSFWSPPAVIGRVWWGRDGFGGAVRRVRREWVGPQTVASIRVDPDTGALKKAGVRQRRDGTWEVKPPRPRRNVTAKQRIAEMQQRNAAAADRHAEAQAALPKPMTERVVRDAGGRFNGSRPAVRQPSLTRVKCLWCRGTGQRVLFTGDGQMKTITGVMACNHRAAPTRGSQPQAPAAETDFLFCLRCDDSGEDPGGGECGTCHGWVNKYSRTY